MTVTIQQLEEIIDSKEGEHLEFKEAKNNFHGFPRRGQCPVAVRPENQFPDGNQFVA